MFVVTKVSAPGLSIFNSDLVNQVKRSNDTWLSGCFQSYKYLIGCEKHIRREFTFNSTLQAVVDRFIHKSSLSVMKAERIAFRDIAIVGVHVRRSDTVLSKSLENGQVEVPASYIHNAMHYFGKIYRYPLFIVASDDIPWCKRNINKTGKHVVLSPFGFKNYMYDFVMLSSCNHSIATTGSFGWMAAWIAGGETVYYKDFPRNGTKLGRGVSKLDRYPPTWIAMSWIW